VPRDPAAVESRLIRAAKRGDRGARRRLVVRHLGLVRAVAGRYAGMGLAADDLVQEGCVGLLDAVDRWDRTRGVPFEAFARFRVRVAIRDALTARARLIRVPKHLSERRRALRRLEETLTSERRRAVSLREVAAATGLSLDRVERAWVVPTATADALERADGAPRDPAEELVALEEARAVDEAVRRLPPRQQLLIAHRYGLGGREESIGEIAEELHVSRRRALSIERQALATLRRSLDGPT
jgi:RNA polymerase primary sigma factor